MIEDAIEQHVLAAPQGLASRSPDNPHYRFGIKMKLNPKKSKDPEPQQSPAKQDRPDEDLTNKVPETAENFEHLLRRIVIEKSKSKSRQ